MIMTDSNDTAVQVALAYHQAWTGTTSSRL
jgi:hypothetical protein